MAFVMPEVLVGHPCVFNVDSRLQTAGMTYFGTNFRVNDRKMLSYREFVIPESFLLLPMTEGILLVLVHLSDCVRFRTPPSTIPAGPQKYGVREEMMLTAETGPMVSSRSPEMSITERMTESRSEEGLWWKKSRQALSRLFEGYCKDYGPEAGDKIIRCIIDVFGGCRITIPAKPPSNPDNAQSLLALYAYLCDCFGHASGGAIMRKFILELKGCRISFPDHADLYREERNAKMRNMFNGNNYKELAITFGIDQSQVWRIVNEGEYLPK